MGYTGTYLLQDFNDLTEIYKSEVEPTSPSVGQLWLDISVVPSSLKRYVLINEVGSWEILNTYVELNQVNSQIDEISLLLNQSTSANYLTPNEKLNAYAEWVDLKTIYVYLTNRVNGFNSSGGMLDTDVGQQAIELFRKLTMSFISLKRDFIKLGIIEVDNFNVSTLSISPIPYQPGYVIAYFSPQITSPFLAGTKIKVSGVSPETYNGVWTIVQSGNDPTYGLDYVVWASSEITPATVQGKITAVYSFLDIINFNPEIYLGTIETNPYYNLILTEYMLFSAASDSIDNIKINEIAYTYGIYYLQDISLFNANVKEITIFFENMYLSAITYGDQVTGSLNPAGGRISGDWITDINAHTITTGTINVERLNLKGMTVYNDKNTATLSIDQYGNLATRGYIFAENGVFNGTVYAKDGVFTGTVNALGGRFGNEMLVDGYFYAGNSAGISGEQTSDIRIWAGSTYNDREEAPFRVNKNGNMYASGATVTGIINATGGSFTDSINLTGKIAVGSAADSAGITGYDTYSEIPNITVTAVVNGTGTFTSNSHGLLNLDTVITSINTGVNFTFEQVAPTGLKDKTIYYVRYINANSFQLSLTPTGSIVTYTTNIGLDFTKWHFSKTDQNSIRFWAGSDYNNRKTAPFRVLQNGDIYATNGYFSGSINSTGSLSGALTAGNIYIKNNNYWDSIDNVSAGDGWSLVIFPDDESTSTVPRYDTYSFLAVESGIFTQNYNFNFYRKSDSSRDKDITSLNGLYGRIDHIQESLLFKNIGSFSTDENSIGKLQGGSLRLFYKSAPTIEDIKNQSDEQLRISSTIDGGIFLTNKLSFIAPYSGFSNDPSLFSYPKISIGTKTVAQNSSLTIDGGLAVLDTIKFFNIDVDYINNNGTSITSDDGKLKFTKILNGVSIDFID